MNVRGLTVSRTFSVPRTWTSVLSAVTGPIRSTANWNVGCRSTSKKSAERRWVSRLSRPVSSEADSTVTVPSPVPSVGQHPLGVHGLEHAADRGQAPEGLVPDGHLVAGGIEGPLLAHDGLPERSRMADADRLARYLLASNYLAGEIVARWPILVNVKRDGWAQRGRRDLPLDGGPGAAAAVEPAPGGVPAAERAPARRRRGQHRRGALGLPGAVVPGRAARSTRRR